jgi:hypothetical protein
MPEPGTPDGLGHPDLQLLREIARDHDDVAAMGVKQPEQVIREAAADPASVIGFANQRATSAFGRGFAPLAAGTWLDGFLIGIELARRQARQVKGGTP